MMFIRDLKGEEYFLQGVIKHEQEINGDERIDLDIHYTGKNKIFMNQHDDLKMWVILFENKEYRIISTQVKGYGDKYFISVVARLEILDWMKRTRIYQRIDASLTVNEAFNLVFEPDDPFTYQIVDNASSERFEGLGDGETKVEVFKTLIERYGYEINILGNVVYLHSKIGDDANFEYRYKVNSQDITKEVNADDMFTYIQGFGDYSDDEENVQVADKAKLKREYVSPLESVIGHRREAPAIKDGRVTKVETLDRMMRKVVDESLQISFTADIYDMSNHGYEYQHAKLGDRVFLVDERIDLDTEIRVVKIVRNVSDTGQILDMEITFGSAGIADSYGSSLSGTVRDMQEILKGNRVLPFFALDRVVRSMTSKVQNTSSELTFADNGLLAVEKNNPNNVLILNSSGLVLSTDGGNTGRTAITAEGIVANAITTGTLNTQLVTIVGENSLIYMNGQEIGATSNTTKSQTFIRPRGLYITRPDGAVYMQDGVPSMSFDVQPISFYADGIVTFDGRFYRTSSTNFEIFNVVYAEHSARYITFTYLADWGAESENSHGNVGLRIEEFGDLNVSAQESVLAGNNISTQQGNITLDLGTPTYKPLYFYLKIKNESGNTKNIARMRTLRVYMRG
ncbi:phage tail spike protein [Staphylococcus simulans]|uniref:phage tail spike protein n=1 Tax=Staphylococcus simulans TaxID=1286 RepID=UPI001F25199F|nr:phage tail spike protein [Staphylococcus simulans]